MTQRLHDGRAENLFTPEQLKFLAENFGTTTAFKAPSNSKYSTHTVVDCMDAKTVEKDAIVQDNTVFTSEEAAKQTLDAEEVSHDRPKAEPLPEIDTSKLFDLHKWFKHTSVVSLDKFPKRWAAFQERATKAGLTGYKKFHAIEGDKVPPSGWFRGGNGAWGCLMSHLRIVQDALMDDVPGHILVFEDDAVFSDDWLERMHNIMEEVGDDWDMLYLGGQHLHMPRVKPYRMPFNKEVINARNINRTHAFAINKKFLRKYQQHIMYAPDYIDAKSNFHIDHQLGILHQHQNYKILAAQPWINGQGAGLSWTCGRKTGENWWKINEQQILKQD